VRPRWVAVLRLEEVATGMHPTAHVGRAGGVKRMVASVSVGMDEAAVAGQELLGELLRAAGAEVEDRVWIRLVAEVYPGVGGAPRVSSTTGVSSACRAKEARMRRHMRSSSGVSNWAQRLIWSHRVERETSQPSRARMPSSR
jgi:hypothetical protein